MIINALSALIAISGNALFLFTLKNSRVLRGPTYILTGTLSLMDFLVGIIIQPLFILATGKTYMQVSLGNVFVYANSSHWINDTFDNDQH